MEWEFENGTVERIKNVYTCKAGNFEDMIIAESRDHAKIKFNQLTTLMGKPISNEVDVRFMYTIPK